MKLDHQLSSKPVSSSFSHHIGWNLVYFSLAKEWQIHYTCAFTGPPLPSTDITNQSQPSLPPTSMETYSSHTLLMALG